MGERKRQHHFSSKNVVVAAKKKFRGVKCDYFKCQRHELLPIVICCILTIGPQSSSSWQRRNRQLSNKKNMFNIILQDSHLLQLRQSELKLLRMTSIDFLFSVHFREIEGQKWITILLKMNNWLTCSRRALGWLLKKNPALTSLSQFRMRLLEKRPGSTPDIGTLNIFDIT